MILISQVRTLTGPLILSVAGRNHFSLWCFVCILLLVVNVSRAAIDRQYRSNLPDLACWKQTVPFPKGERFPAGLILELDSYGLISSAARTGIDPRLVPH